MRKSTLSGNQNDKIQDLLSQKILKKSANHL